MPPRRRNKENQGLPARWRFYHGAYRYQVPPGQEAAWDGKRQFTLGKTLSEAYRVWAERVGRQDKIPNVDKLLDRYAILVIPKKAKRTQKENRRQVPVLKKHFGHFAVAGPKQPKPRHIYEYVSKNQHRLTAAHREMELLSHAFTMAVQWGEIERHPWKREVRFDRELSPKGSDRYVEDWEIIEALKLKPRRKRGSVLMCQAYIRIKLLTGLRQTDMLRIRLADMDDIGLRVAISKTAKTTRHKQHFSWTPELEHAVAMAKAARPVDIGPWLFCNRSGECYLNEDNQANGFQSVWGRFMTRVLRETGLTVRYAERDIRAKVASDADSLQRAQEILGHADAALTKRVYVRKAQLIRPAKGVKE